MEDLDALRKEIGNVVEVAGRKLRSNGGLTIQDLTDLTATLIQSAEAIATIKNVTIMRMQSR